MSVNRRHDDLGPGIAFARRVKRLEEKTYWPFIAGIAERLLSIYQTLLSRDVVELMSGTVTAFWRYNVDKAVGDFHHLAERWTELSLQPEFAPSVAASSCLYFFRWAVKGAIRSDDRVVAAEFIRASIVYLPLALDNGRLRRIDLTIQEPRKMDQPSILRPASAPWLDREIAYQDCLLAWAEQANAENEELVRMNLMGRCWKEDPGVPSTD